MLFHSCVRLTINTKGNDRAGCWVNISNPLCVPPTNGFNPALIPRHSDLPSITTYNHTVFSPSWCPPHATATKQALSFLSHPNSLPSHPSVPAHHPHLSHWSLSTLICLVSTGELRAHLRVISCANLPRGRMDVSATLSADLLAAVCGQLEFTPTGDVAMLKHERNQTILALSNVCRLWHHHITGCKHLLHDIAFDASCEGSIVTAGAFLKMLEGTRVPINIYANLGQSPHPSPMVMGLFVRLHPHIPHIVHFEYDGDMAGYRPYLDRPAPNLLFFSDGFDTHPGSGPPLFHG